MKTHPTTQNVRDDEERERLRRVAIYEAQWRKEHKITYIVD
jgi:hypothetical protein